MRYTVEVLDRSWQVIGHEVPASSEFLAVAKVGSRPGMYRTAAEVEPRRHYFWLPPGGGLEAMDR